MTAATQTLSVVVPTFNEEANVGPLYERLAPVYTEYKVGHYSRRFTVSSDVDADKISARVTNGVLALELPKAERAKPRQIKVDFAPAS